MTMRASFLLGALLLIAVSSCSAFVAPSPSLVQTTHPSNSRLMATQDEILSAYQKKIGVKAAQKVAEALPKAPPVIDTPPVVVEAPSPVVTEKVAKVVVNTVRPSTPTSPGTDPISSLWNTVTSPFKSLPDPFENVKIPKEPLKDVDLSIPDVSVNIKESLKSVNVPSVDLKSVSVPDLKSVSVPDLKSVSFPDLKSLSESVKSVDLKSVSESIKTSMQLSPPERPVASGVILPDGGRLPTLLDWWNTHGPKTQSAGPSFGDTLTQWKESISSSNVNILQVLAEGLRVTEFGAWYVAGLCLVAWRLQISRQESLYGKKLSEAEKKAQQAAEAATVAAQGATLTKELATKKSSKKSMESILSESQMQALEVEKQAMKKELETLQKETEDLKRQLKAANVNGAVEVPPPAAAPKRTVEPRAPKEGERVLEIIKEQDVANAAATKPKRALKKKTAPKKKAAKKEKVVKETVVAKKKKTGPRKEKVVKAEAVAVLEKEPVVVAEEEDLEVEVAGAKDVFYANATAPATAKPKKKAAAKKAAVKKATPAAKKAAPASSSSDNPWSSLSPSTLKRKTVKELSAYLSERGVQVTNDEGKPLKKADLVDAVLTL